ncbi:hypothetical protein HY411_02725 [Candidatus Gottesmanbacteria bacterium]|nr:hypothetical protein [Candidatus Gottesmanbacteria bacterium]
MNVVRHLLVLTIVVFTLALFTPSVHAAKPRVRKSAPVTTRKVIPGVSFSSAKFSAASRSVIISFFNLDKVSKISYLLSYTGSGQAQGVGGSISPSGATDSRDLYFGTCSKGVCTPHYNIKNAKLLVTATLTSGGINIKRYILRPKW